MSQIHIHSVSVRENKISRMTSTLFLSLGLLLLFSLANSAQAYEWSKKSLEIAGNTDFPKQAVSSPLGQLQRKGYVFGLKMNFEVNTIFSKSKQKLNSEQLINNFSSENYLSSGNHFPNELPLEPEMSIGAKPAKLIEIRF